MRHDIYWVDLPRPDSPANRSSEAEYVNVGTFTTRKAAVEFLQEAYGIPSKHAGFFITHGRDDV